jgi:hypothetical protein
MANRPTGVRRTLVVFATFTGLLLSMAQSCDTACGSSSTEASSGSSTRTTIRPSGDSSGAQYFQDRQKGYDGTGDNGSSTTTTTRTTRTTATPGECTSTGGTRTTSSRSTGTKSTNGKSKNNGSAFDEGYDKGYDEGYDDGYDDGRRKNSDRSTSDDG